MKFKPTLCIVIASIPLLGCSSSTKPLLRQDPLIVASCPDLTPLSDNSFGATTAKVIEIAGIYYACRAAAGVK